MGLDLSSLSWMEKGSYFLRNIYCLTPVLIAPRVMVSGVKPRWLSYLSRFLTIPSVTDSPVSAAPMHAGCDGPLIGAATTPVCPRGRSIPPHSIERSLPWFYH